MKRGQVTTFIIVAVVILFVIVITVVFLQENKSEFSQIDPSIIEIRSLIMNCIEESGKKSLKLIGNQGGYYNKPNNYYNLGWTFIPYYYLKGQEFNPSIDEVEKEISKPINKNFNICIENQDFNNYLVSHSNPKSEIIIEEDKTLITIDSQVSINKEKNSEEIDLKKLPIEIPSKLLNMIDLSRFITESHANYEGNICISCISNKAGEYNLTVKIYDIENLTQFIAIFSNDNVSHPELFQFANKYNE